MPGICDFRMSLPRFRRTHLAKQIAMKKTSIALVASLGLAACGGGGGGTGAGSPPVVVPTPILGALQVTPAQIALNAPGASQSVAVSQSNYSGVFAAALDSASCSGVASLDHSTSATGFTITA